MTEWIGRDLERLRKLRGLRREDLAAQLPVPVSASTIRNIEHDVHYNVSLEQLRHIAAVLGAQVKVSIEEIPDGNHDDMSSGKRIVDNEYFIRHIRANHPGCLLTNSQIGRRMWGFASSHGAELVRERKQLKRQVDSSSGTTLHPSPTTAAEYQILERDFPVLQRFADRLGRSFPDGKGGILVPAA
ncbi:MAG: helix-turn-helix domain-containing protein [Gemmatimonadaceae bacterium]